MSKLKQERDSNAQILRSESKVDIQGNYQHEFEADNGITVEEYGLAGVFVSGSSKWVDSNGTPIQLSYTAGVDGYRPQGAHLPTPPPTPDYVLKALAYIESHPNVNDPYAYRPDPTYDSDDYPKTTKIGRSTKHVVGTTIKEPLRYPAPPLFK